VNAECLSAKKQNVLASQEFAFIVVLVRPIASAAVRRRKKNKNRERPLRPFLF